MSGEAGTPGGGSDHGSPAAGAIDPGTARRMSDLGTADAGAAPELPNRAPQVRQQARQQQAAKPEAPREPLKPLSDAEIAEADGNSVQEEAETVQDDLEQQVADGEITPEQAYEKYKQWMESADIPEEFMDRALWIDGKKGKRPIRLRDIRQNVLLYDDYQEKTTELAKHRRNVERGEQGQRALVEDVVSGDAARARRVFESFGEKGAASMRALVIDYIKQEMKIESLPPELRDEYRSNMLAKVERDRLLAQTQAREAYERQQAEAAQAEQGEMAPDVQYTSQHIEQRLEAIIKSQRIVKSPAYERELGQLLTEAATGKRGPDGRWIEAPSIQPGKLPSDALLERLAVAARQRVDELIAAHGAPRAPRADPPPPILSRGTGPAAKPGQRGNISQPERRTFADLTNKRQ